jgi:hypothetical protein
LLVSLKHFFFVELKGVCFIIGLSTLFERSLRDTSVTQGRPLTLDCELDIKKGVPTIVW